MGQEISLPLVLPSLKEKTMDLKAAFEIAVEVHGNKRDKAGEPYLAHICRVMSAMDTDEERVVAILHDAMEDGPSMVTADWRLTFYPEHLLLAVLALTRVPGEPYMDYIRRLSKNPLAVKVKMADLRDNMDYRRLDKLDPAERHRLHLKYHEASYYLAGGELLEPIPAESPDSSQPASS
jgi:(p)ppGpp synthase/HD superfamily hydrolase